MIRVEPFVSFFLVITTSGEAGTGRLMAGGAKNEMMLCGRIYSRINHHSLIPRSG